MEERVAERDFLRRRVSEAQLSRGGTPTRNARCVDLARVAAQSLVGSAAHALRRSAHAAMDLSLQPARPAQQTLMQSNHLVLETVEMVNAFGLKCEEKLLRLHQKMQRLEVDVRLLETKLNSIPGLESAAPPPAAGGASASASGDPAAAPPAPTGGGAIVPAEGGGGGGGGDAPPPAAAAAADAPAEPAAPQPMIKDDPRFVKFFKMLAYGVPLPVVQGKWKEETGLDPALLSDPTGPAPPAAAADDDDTDI